MDVRRAFRSLFLGLAWASIWPAYLVLLAQAARLGPWPRNLGILASTALHGLALGVVHSRGPGLADAARRLGRAVPGRPRGRSAAQLCRAGRFLAAAAVVCLVPAYLLTHGEIAPDGRPITAAAISRFFILGFEICVWVTLFWLLRRGSALMSWFDLEAVQAESGEDARVSLASAAQRHAGRPGGDLRLDRPRPGWPGLSRRRRLLAWVFLAAVAGIVVLDVRGYRFTSRRLAVGGTETLAVALACWACIAAWPDHRPARPGDGAGPGRPGPAPDLGGRLAGLVARSGAWTPLGTAGRCEALAADDPVQPEDLAGRLRQLLSLRGRAARRPRLRLGLGARLRPAPVPGQPADLVPGRPDARDPRRPGQGDRP